MSSRSQAPRSGTRVVLLSGAASGAISRTCVAPLERAKIELMVGRFMAAPTASLDVSRQRASTIRSHIMQGNANALKLRSRTITLPPKPRVVGTNVISVLRQVVRTEGWRGLLRGNTLNVLRIAPTKAVELAVWEKFRSSKGGRTLTPRERVVGGSFASMLGTAVTHPIDTVRTRATIGQGGGADPWRHCLVIARTEGVKGFFRGFVPNLVRVAPYGAVNYGAYDILQTGYKKFRKFTGQPPANPAGLENALWGGLSGAMAQTVVYPIEMLQRRMQASTGQGISFGVASLRELVAREGVGVLYTGLSSNYAKTIPAAAIGWWSYEVIKDMLEEKEKNQK
ncbi:mitochondrial phosphate transporter [Pycnococcus provasolii]